MPESAHKGATLVEVDFGNQAASEEDHKVLALRQFRCGLVIDDGLMRSLLMQMVRIWPADGTNRSTKDIMIHIVVI